MASPSRSSLTHTSKKASKSQHQSVARHGSYNFDMGLQDTSPSFVSFEHTQYDDVLNNNTYATPFMFDILWKEFCQILYDYAIIAFPTDEQRQAAMIGFSQRQGQLSQAERQIIQTIPNYRLVLSVFPRLQEMLSKLSTNTRSLINDTNKLVHADRTGAVIAIPMSDITGLASNMANTAISNMRERTSNTISTATTSSTGNSRSAVSELGNIYARNDEGDLPPLRDLLVNQCELLEKACKAAIETILGHLQRINAGRDPVLLVNNQVVPNPDYKDASIVHANGAPLSAVGDIVQRLTLIMEVQSFLTIVLVMPIPMELIQETDRRSIFTIGYERQLNKVYQENAWQEALSRPVVLDFLDSTVYMRMLLGAIPAAANMRIGDWRKANGLHRVSAKLKEAFVALLSFSLQANKPMVVSMLLATPRVIANLADFPIDTLLNFAVAVYAKKSLQIYGNCITTALDIIRSKDVDYSNGAVANYVTTLTKVIPVLLSRSINHLKYHLSYLMVLFGGPQERLVLRTADISTDSLYQQLFDGAVIRYNNMVNAERINDINSRSAGLNQSMIQMQLERQTNNRERREFALQSILLPLFDWVNNVAQPALENMLTAATDEYIRISQMKR